MLFACNYCSGNKEAGEFTEEAQAEALQRSLSKAVSLLSDDLKNLILKYSDDVESYLTTLIESYIKINE